MRAGNLVKSTATAVMCCIFMVSAALAGSSIVEGGFCLEMDGRDCAAQLTSEKVSLSEAPSSQSGVKRLYYRTKISAAEDSVIVHIWQRDGSSNTTGLIHVPKSGRLKAVASDMEDRVRSVLKSQQAENPSAISIQGVLLGIKASSGFRTYSSVIAKPGVYTVRVVDTNGSLIAGGDAKTVTVVP